MESTIVHLGEYYRVNCPYCDDTSHRLYVNHMWCTPDPVNDRPMRHLAICYNEDCLKTNYAEFEDRVFGHINADELAALKAAMAARLAPVYDDEAEELGRPSPPGEIIPLADLPAEHPAVKYLAARGFAARELTDTWGVGVCVHAFGAYASMAQRIYIPVRLRDELVGWQGRWPGDDWKKLGVQKYYNLPRFKKSRVLYNYDRAAERRVLVVCEGVTDVWAVGTPAVALLGKTVSATQTEFLREWAERTEGLLVLMLDADAWNLADRRHPGLGEGRHIALLSGLKELAGGRLVEVILPDGSDPAQLGRKAVWAEIGRACKEAGYDLRSFRRRL
jgi:hypothetical protein